MANQKVACLPPQRERGEEGSKVEKRKEEEGGFIMHASNVDKT